MAGFLPTATERIDDLASELVLSLQFQRQDQFRCEVIDPFGGSWQKTSHVRFPSMSV